MSVNSYDYGPNNLLQKTLELFIMQLEQLNNKIEDLEEKIDNIQFKVLYINKEPNISVHYKNRKKNDMNNIDWNSVHLY